MMDYDRLAAEYALHRRVHPDVWLDLLHNTDLRPTSCILEVGCGTGNYITMLAQQFGCAAWGIDPSEGMLAQARARAPQVNFNVGRGEQLDFPAEMFDLVFSVDVIHHVEDRPRYFAEAYRVLKPGGKVCTVTDSEAIIRNREPLSNYFPETVPIELARYPALAELQQLMAAAGFCNLLENSVEFMHELADIQMYRDRAFSVLHLIPEAAFARGIARMEADLQRGPLQRISRYVLLWGEK